MIDEWRVLVARTTTGQIVGDIRISDVPKFERRISDPGSYTVEVYLGTGANTAADLHEFTETGAYSWVVCYGDHVVQAGPVRTWQFTDSARTLSVSGAGIGSEFDRRVLRNPRGHTAITDPSEDLVLRDLSVRGLMGELVRANLAQRGYGLPIVLPEPEPGPESVTYYGYDLANVWERLRDLSTREDGPEFEFQPRLVDGGTRVEWVLDLGDPLLGARDTALVWDYGAAIGAIDLDIDGSRTPAARVWVKGAGGGRDLLTGVAAVDRPGTPPVDVVNTEHVSERRQDVLDSYARASLAAGQAPGTRWETHLRLDKPGSGLDDWALGDAPTIAISRHPWLADGIYRRRVTGFSDASATEIALDLDVMPPP
ncbi:hypothetical protein E1161_13310 [Saccharopolyspora aridisoli]|uniref:Minor tail protein n=1 Tax=Saccharopolyspora aridisoli TaxID=2530385 RepID=A0A4R4UPZ8_9PSEU|nr:hypothetical protein [Saccharopolyspora aridisoli]TDC92346.1 hypothetical protein E1161_13310 [Saccharopolyspora aridisoli]